MALVGVNVAVAKLLAEDLSVPMIAGLRCLIACAVLWPLARMIDGPVTVPRDVRTNLFWQAAFGTVLYNAALLAGLRLTGALEAGLVLATLPAVIALGGAVFLRETLAPRQWLAVVLAAGGMGAIALARGGGVTGSLWGDALVFVAVCGEAIYAVLARRIAGRVPVVTASLWMQVFSVALLVPFCLPFLGDVLALADPVVLGLLVFHALTASVACLLLWYAGLQRVEAGVAGIFTAFLPGTAAAVAILVLGERATASHVLGFALLLGSVLLATWPRRR